MLTQHTVLEGVTAERAEVAQRLLEVENQVQNAAFVLQEKLKEASQEAAQQSEARIEAEITAARQCVDRLGDHKEILKQRRLVREERLTRMDAEVVNLT
jgi:phosphate uptake regulator